MGVQAATRACSKVQSRYASIGSGDGSVTTVRAQRVPGELESEKQARAEFTPRREEELQGIVAIPTSDPYGVLYPPGVSKVALLTIRARMHSHQACPCGRS